jgi:hypothetical protein
MDRDLDRDVERDQDAAPFEWVNAWAAAKPGAPAPETIAADLAADPPTVVARATPVARDQLLRDIAEIERARDALAALPAPVSGKRRTQALTLVAARTTDPVPVVIGGVLALVMLAVFGAAAAMTKLAR